MGWIRRWSEEHPEGEELQHYGFGKWELSLWFSLDLWGLGVESQREYGNGGYWPDRLHLSLQLGPFILAAMRTWNESR